MAAHDHRWKTSWTPFQQSKRIYGTFARMPERMWSPVLRATNISKPGDMMDAKNISDFKRRDLDAYFTRDNRVVPALFKAFPELQTDITGVLEPFCGAGHLAEPIRLKQIPVFASDIQDYGYKHQFEKADFLDTRSLPIGVNAIISNPPFNKKTIRQIIEHAMALLPDDGYLVFLLNHRFDAVSDRCDLFSEEFGFYARCPLPFRMWMFKPRNPKDSPGQNHCFFVWKKAWKQPSNNIYLSADGFESGGPHVLFSVNAFTENASVWHTQSHNQAL